jgi:pseudaminic acid synthase
LKDGDVFPEKNVRSIRPGFGMHPKYYKDILGKKVTSDLKKGARVNLEYIKQHYYSLKF